MSNNKQQTGVEYLVEQLFPKALSAEQYYHIEQAKEMEKERMIDFAQFYAVIHCMGDITKNADEYYNETYGGNK
jgi:hypothetical protein